MTAQQPKILSRQLLPILLALCFEFLPVVCCGKEEKALQKLVVRIPAAVEMSESNRPETNELDVRIHTTGGVAIAVSTASLATMAETKADSVFILHSGHRCIVRLSFDRPQMFRKTISGEDFLHYQVPRGDRPVLTVSPL